jgi:transcriptional regulator with XRE-family HTH domain
MKRSVGENIRRIRGLRGMSQKELAEKVGCSLAHISTLEAPGMKTSVSIESLFDIADALGVSVAKLFEMK